MTASQLPITLALSFTALDQWETQDPKFVLQTLLGDKGKPTPAMENGIRKHSEWQTIIKETGCIPDELGGGKLNDPQTEHFVHGIFNASENLRIIVRGKIDCRDLPTNYDWKTGKKPAEDYIKYSKQHIIYKTLDPEADRFEYRCLNQDKGELTIGAINLTDKMVEFGTDLIKDYGTGIAKYLQRTKMLERVLEKQSKGTWVTLSKAGLI